MASEGSDLHSFLAEKGLRVETNPAKGRCLIASRRFARGDTVLSQDPYVSVLDSNSFRTRCDACYQLTMNLKRCSACKETWYCSSACQKREWKMHQHECQAIICLKKEKQHSITSSLRLMLRLLIKRKLQYDGILIKTATDDYSLIELLPSHMSDVSENQLILYAQMANLMNIIKPSDDMNFKEIAENFSRFSCNAHTICDSQLRPIGTGLYPVISIINHSCLPNSVIQFEGKHATVRAIEPIEEGCELTLAYIEVAASTTTRKTMLQEQYFFNCKCPRCCKLETPSGFHEDAILEGFRCPLEHCGGVLISDSVNSKMLLCHSCQYKLNEETMTSLKRQIQNKENEASKALTDGNYTKAKSLYESIENLQTLLWHPYSVQLMRTRDILLKICMELQNWKEALKYCQLTIPVYERAYPPYHPMKGLQYYTCGKLEWFLENTMEALKYYEKAAEILVVIHGRNSEMVKELYDRIQEARAEAAHLNTIHDED